MPRASRTETSSSASPAPAAGASAPTPYTAEQIRDATHVGRTYTFRIEAAGQPPVLRTLTFVHIDAEGADVRSEVHDEQGHELQPATTAHATWDELRRHAEFPRDAVTTREESVTVPAGTYPSVVYTVHHDDGSIEHFYFAHTMPGAPVQFDMERNGAREMTSTLTRYSAGQ